MTFHKTAGKRGLPTKKVTKKRLLPTPTTTAIAERNLGSELANRPISLEFTSESENFVFTGEMGITEFIAQLGNNPAADLTKASLCRRLFKVLPPAYALAILKQRLPELIDLSVDPDEEEDDYDEEEGFDC